MIDHVAPPLHAALVYAGRRWPVLPLHAPTGDGRCTCRRDCGSVAKHPRTPRGLRDATTDAGLLRGWWSHWPGANVGVRTGTPGGIVAVDVDNAEAGEALLELASGRELGGLVVRTGRGEQRWYATPAGVAIGNRARILGVSGLDARGADGYVVAPPSLHASGRRYAFLGGSLAPAPDWLLELLMVSSGPTVVDVTPPHEQGQADPAYGRGVLARRCAAVRAEPPGGRTYALLRASTTVAGFVAGGSIDAAEAEAALLAAALDAGFGEQKARRTIASGFARGLARPLYAPARATAAEARLERVRRIASSTTADEVLG